MGQHSYLYTPNFKPLVPNTVMLLDDLNPVLLFFVTGGVNIRAALGVNIDQWPAMVQAAVGGGQACSAGICQEGGGSG